MLFFKKGYVSGIKTTTSKILKNKYATKVILESIEVPVPKGFVIPVLSKNSVLEVCSVLGYPVCLKPPSGKWGKGVFPGLRNESEVVDALSSLRDLTDYVLIEEHVVGVDARITTVGGRFVAASLRLPAYLEGDGVSTVHELVDKKISERLRKKAQRARSLKIDEEAVRVLAGQGLNVDSVVGKGCIVNLRKNSNLSTGGESVDITSHIPVEVIRKVEKALTVFPDLIMSGVDVIFEEDPRLGGSEFKLIEINRFPGIRGHHFPDHGDSVSACA